MVPHSLPEVDAPVRSAVQYAEHPNDRAVVVQNVEHHGSQSTEPSTIESNVTKRIVLMCASPLFNGLTPKECKEIASCAYPRTFRCNEVLFTQGQPVRGLVLLMCGSVKLTQVSASGKEVVLWMNGSGDAMGIPGDSLSSVHTCSARAVEQCQALIWEYTRVQILVAQYPQLRKNIGQILVSRLEELEERYREIATEKVAKRLALALSRLVKQVGKKAADGIEISLSREELAQFTGTSLFTISRILSQWAELGVVVPRREAVLLPDPKRLELVGCEED